MTNKEQKHNPLHDYIGINLKKQQLTLSLQIEGGLILVTGTFHFFCNGFNILFMCDFLFSQDF